MNTLMMLLVGLALGSLSSGATAIGGDLPELPPLPAREAPTVLTESTRGEIAFDTRSPFDFDVLLARYEQTPVTTGRGTLFLPDGVGPANKAPAVVLLPGSGGISPGREMEYGAWLAAEGVAALVIDYYSARGFTAASAYRDKTAGVTEFDVVTDAYAGLRALNAHPAIDAARVGVVGFSYGGMAVRIAMDARVRERLAPDLLPFAAHVDFYGPCFQDMGTARTTGAPLLSLRGGEDASNDLVACAREEARLRAAGSAVDTVVYANAGHAWEVTRPREKNTFPYIDGCTMTFDARGLPAVNSRQMIAADTDPDRTVRHRLRLDSGRFFEGCLKVGYIVGRDEPVKQRADAQLLQFLRRAIGQ